MLNEYFQIAVRAIRSSRGVVDKFIGDAIMAVWGVPHSRPEDTRNAVTACLAIRQALEALNERRVARKEMPLRIGMGLNFGPVVAGNIGSDERMEYTVVGDAVNVASRLESLTKEVKTDLLVTQSVMESVKSYFQFEPAGSLKVRGKSATVTTYRVLGYEDAQGKTVLVAEPSLKVSPLKPEGDPAPSTNPADLESKKPKAA